MDQSITTITGYEFSKRIIDYYGANKERGAGDVLLECAANQWCDWFANYDSFYQNPKEEENKERFSLIIQDICALYNTRGGVVIIGIGPNDPIIRTRGLQDYVKKTCDQMCKYNTLELKKDERKRIKRLFETRIVCCQGREIIALLVRSASAGLRHPIATDSYYVRDYRQKKSRLASGVNTANSTLIEDWKREDYLNRDDLKQKLVELNIPVAPLKHLSFGRALRNALTRQFSAKELFSTLIRVSRAGFVIMTLLQFLPIGYEVYHCDSDLTVSHALKAFIVGIIPFVAPYWAAQGAIHAWGQSVVVSYLTFFWPYILYACASLFTVVDWLMLKRETLVKVGKVIVFFAVVSACIVVYLGYVSCKNRIKAIGGYEVTSEDVVPVIGINELIVRSVEAVESEVMGKFDEMHPCDIYGRIAQVDYNKRYAYLQMLKKGLIRVETIYMPNDGKRTKLVDALGGPDQGLIDCLSALSKSVKECIECHRPEDFDRMWQKTSILNRRFFERAMEIGIYCKGG